MSETQNAKNGTLRQRAEVLLEVQPEDYGSLNPEEIRNVLHELQVHQVELEIQNEELRNAQKALENVRARYARLYQNAPMGYVIVDRSGIIKQTNARFERLLHIDGSKLRGRAFPELLSEDDGSLFRARFRVFFKNPEGKQMEVRLAGAKGAVIFAQIEAFPHQQEPDQDDSEQGYDELLIAISDITAQKKAQSELQQALEVSQAREQEIAKLLQGARAVLKQENFQVTARKVFDYCRELLGATSGYVALLSEDGEENEVLFLEAGGLPCSVDPALPMPIRGLREQAYAQNKAVYHNDFMNSEWADYLPGGHVNLKNVLFAPLVLNDQTVGIIGLANKPAPFTDNDARIAGGFGELAAIALEKGRNQDLREAAEQEQTRLIQELREALARVKQLGGLLPICSSCKKIRDDQGYWNQIENYLKQHSEAEFTHGICPECAKRLYPELDLFDDQDLS